MASKFLVWIDTPTNENVVESSEFANLLDRTRGFKSGTVAVSKNVNSGLRQANLVAAALMNAISPDSNLDFRSSLTAVTNEIKNQLPVGLYLKPVPNYDVSMSTTNSARTSLANTVEAAYCIAFGIGNKLYQSQCMAVGQNNTVGASSDAQYSIVSGYNNISEIRMGLVVGQNQIAKCGTGSIMAGSSSSWNSTNTLALFGRYNDDYNGAQDYFGVNFILGGGSGPSDRRNALITTNSGQITNQTNYKLLGSGSARQAAFGDENQTNGNYAIACGYGNIINFPGLTCGYCSSVTQTRPASVDSSTPRTFTVGCGTSTVNRKNGIEVYGDGTVAVLNNPSDSKCTIIRALHVAKADAAHVRISNNAAPVTNGSGTLNIDEGLYHVYFVHSSQNTICNFGFMSLKTEQDSFSQVTYIDTVGLAICNINVTADGQNSTIKISSTSQVSSSAPNADGTLYLVRIYDAEVSQW